MGLQCLGFGSQLSMHGQHSMSGLHFFLCLQTQPFTTQESHRFFPQLWCPDGQYSSYGQLFFTPMTEALRIIMHMGEPLPEQQTYEFSIGPLIAFFSLTYLFMMYTNGVGASTGAYTDAACVY